MRPAADQLYGDADLIFQQDLAPAHSAKATSTWLKDHGIPVSYRSLLLVPNDPRSYRDYTGNTIAEFF